ncbi:MAG: hypothetical protein L6Q97_22475 [Thermoanaerobaculia bacterium]|nr:hypothetical protein [Thermoanaerobaculia bacterium]
MHTYQHAEQQKSPAVAPIRRGLDDGIAFSFADKRPAARAQETLQAVAVSGPRQTTLTALQRVADSHANPVIQRHTVNAFYWLAKIGKQTPELNLKQVMAAVQEIWKTAGIEIEFSGINEIDLGEIPIEKKGNLKQWVAEAAAKFLNPAILESKGKRRIDVIFTPEFGPWGQAYTKLVPPKEGSYAPFNGPVAIITTDKVQGGTSRKDQYAPSEGSMEALRAQEDYVHLGIINDTAHEIGHLFGLQHMDEDRTGLGKRVPLNPSIKNIEIHWLMHKTLYSQVQMVREERSEKTALELVNDNAKPFIKHILKGKEWFVALRGVEIAKEDAEEALRNLEKGAVWPD